MDRRPKNNEHLQPLQHAEKAQLHHPDVSSYNTCLEGLAKQCFLRVVCSLCSLFKKQNRQRTTSSVNQTPTDNDAVKGLVGHHSLSDSGAVPSAINSSRPTIRPSHEIAHPRTRTFMRKMMSIKWQRSCSDNVPS